MNIQEIVRQEEELYERTIAKGMEKLYEVVAEVKGITVEELKAEERR